MESVTSDTISELELAVETQVRHADAPLFFALKTRRGKWVAFYAPLLIALQTWRVKWLTSDAPFFILLQTCRGKWLASDAPLFIAPQPRRW